jgi:hypothetical protein
MDLRDSLKRVGYDKEEKGKEIWSRWADEGKMDGAFLDKMSVVGPGVLSHKPEGVEIPQGTVQQGWLQRYLPRPFALRIGFTRELIDDGRHKDAFKAKRMLMRAARKTVEYQMTLMLELSADSAQVMADSQPVWSTAHVLKNGQTFSNMFSSFVGSSTTSVAIARQMAGVFPDNDGTVGNNTLRGIVYPDSQHEGWNEVFGSAKNPNAGEFNKINTATYELDVKQIPNRYWQANSSDYCFLTDQDAEDGYQHASRVGVETNSYVDENNMVTWFSLYMRFAACIPYDPRTVIGVHLS